MVKLNTKPTAGTPRTHEGALAVPITPEQELRRSVLACLLWEDEFYEAGEAIAARIARLVREVPAERVAALAVEAREQMKLRHVPLLLVREMARHPGQRKLVGGTLERVIQRPDELAEFLAIYWKDAAVDNGRIVTPLAKQVKKGLAAAFPKFDAYGLAKYNRNGAIKLRDVLFLTHPKPRDQRQAETWKQLADGTLAAPDTWEVALSTGKDKKATFERLLAERKLGALALLRNLRNMVEAGVSDALIREGLCTLDGRRVLPFRYVAAAKAAPTLRDAIDEAMLRSLAQAPKLPGKTLVVIDVSGSMYGSRLSAKSDMDRALAAASLGAIAREMCTDAVVYATAGNDMTRKHQTRRVPDQRGLALVDAIHGLCQPLGGGGIFLKQVIDFLRAREEHADRIIVITDEQDCAIDPNDKAALADPFGFANYLINVASYKNGIGYGPWVHIDGWSEAVLEYIRELERLDACQ
jgi:hypothetical protein